MDRMGAMRLSVLVGLLVILAVVLVSALAFTARRDMNPMVLVTPSPTAVPVPRLPDLVVTVQGPGSAVQGQALGDSIVVEVTNQGNTTARNFSVGIYVSADRTVDQRDSLLLGGREFVPGLGPGETTRVRLTGTNRLPDNLPDGDFYLGVIVDETDAVDEADEGNNAAVWPVSVRAAASATPTPTVTLTHTPIPTRTPVRPTGTATPTTSASPSNTPTPPSRPTETATVTRTPTSTATNTPTAARTPTRVATKTTTVVFPTPLALKVEYSSPLSGSQAAGLAWADGLLWVSDPVRQQVYAVDPWTGKTLLYGTTEAGSPGGLAWDGEALWVADRAGKRLLYQVIPGKGFFTVNAFPAPGRDSAPCGLAFGDGSLWVSHGCSKGDEHDVIYRVDPRDGTVISSFGAPGEEPLGLAFGDGVLWNVDGATGLIYEMDPKTGRVLGTISVSGLRGKVSLIGLAFDGKVLWGSDELNLYQVIP